MKDCAGERDKFKTATIKTKMQGAGVFVSLFLYSVFVFQCVVICL